MTPSQFRKANPHLSDIALAAAYAAHIDPDGARATDAFERWDKVLMGDCTPSFVGIDLAKSIDD